MNLETLLYIILAITFIEVKVLLYCAIKIIIQNSKPVEFHTPHEEEDDISLQPKSYNDLIQKVRSLV